MAFAGSAGSSMTSTQFAQAAIDPWRSRRAVCSSPAGSPASYGSSRFEWQGRTYWFDFAFPGARTILETNGRRWHDDPSDYEHDQEKWSVPGRHGYRLVFANVGQGRAPERRPGERGPGNVARRGRHRPDISASLRCRSATRGGRLVTGCRLPGDQRRRLAGAGVPRRSLPHAGRRSARSRRSSSTRNSATTSSRATRTSSAA